MIYIIIIFKKRLVNNKLMIINYFLNFYLKMLVRIFGRKLINIVLK